MSEHDIVERLKIAQNNTASIYPVKPKLLQDAIDEIVALREMRDAHVRMLRAEFDERDEALEEAAVTCLRKPRDHVIPLGQDNYHDGCVACAAAIRALKDRP